MRPISCSVASLVAASASCTRFVGEVEFVGLLLVLQQIQSQAAVFLARLDRVFMFEEFVSCLLISTVTDRSPVLMVPAAVSSSADAVVSRSLSLTPEDYLDCNSHPVNSGPPMHRLVLFGSALACVSVQACTTILVGKGATADGSRPRSNDGEGATDSPASACPPPHGSMGHLLRRELPATSAVTAAWTPARSGNQSAFAPIGHIPEVPTTFGYFEQTYGAIRQAGGHRRDRRAAACLAQPAGHGGKALMSVDTLTQLAMERAETARAAVLLMGQLSGQCGFYGAGSFEDAAESLLVSDPNEGWIFHILPDDTAHPRSGPRSACPTTASLLSPTFVIGR